MTRERLIPLLLVVAFALDYFFPMNLHAEKAWLLPALMGLSGLVGAIKGKRDSKNSNAAETYKAERQNAIDQYEAALSKAKRGERLRYANALARTRGFAVPEFDPTASESTNLNLPAVPKLKDGGWLDVLGGAAEGWARGDIAEANLNTERGSLPKTDTETTASTTGGSGYVPFDPSAPSGANDPYAALLGRTDYFSNLRPR